VAVDLDHSVVDVEQRVLPEVGGVACGEHAGQPRQREEEPRGHRVELADVAEGEAAQERPQRRGRVAAGEDPAHATVPQQRHVVDRVRTSDHPRDQRGHLQPGVRALVGRHRQMLIDQLS
jgi:hypothetical protein